jgi:hypothetical protein
MNVAVLEALFADRSNYEIIDQAPVARREGMRADLGLMPAYAPEVN